MIVTYRKKKIPPVNQESVLYLRHLENVKNAVSTIDNKAPMLSGKQILKASKMQGDKQRLKSIQDENRQLALKLNIIYRTKGVVDSYNPKAGMRWTKLTKAHDKAWDITEANLVIRKKILKTRPVLDTRDELEKFWKHALGIMDNMARYPLGFSMARPLPVPLKSFPPGRKRVYMDLKIEDARTLGRMVFELYEDVAPKTVKNFMQLCTGQKKGLSYKNCPFHRIVPGLYCQSGDIVEGNGIGGKSIYGPDFPVENFKLEHSQAGTLAMIPVKKNRNSSQFLITFKDLPPLDGRRVVLGYLVSGMNTLRLLEGCGTPSGRPAENVYIQDCGEVFPYKKPSKKKGKTSKSKKSAKGKTHHKATETKSKDNDEEDLAKEENKENEDENKEEAVPEEEEEKEDADADADAAEPDPTDEEDYLNAN